MTVVNGIEIRHIEYQKRNIRDAIRTRDPIDDKLHVITVISNPCQYESRYKLAREFIDRMEEEPDVILYVVELIYGDHQQFLVTQAENPRHLQLKTDCAPLWHKENMINLGVNLLPADWKAMAWIDADLEFDSPSWATDALKILNGECDIVQLFSHCVDMDSIGQTMNVFSSAGFQYQKHAKYKSFGTGRDYWHPGYAWACSRGAYERMGGLYDRAILGSGDNIMFLSLLGYGLKAIHHGSTEEYKRSVREFQNRVEKMAFGYVPGVIRHYYHGNKKNRKYTERWRILLNHRYDPYRFLLYDDLGLLVPNKDMCPTELLDDIFTYFMNRKEDD